MRDVDWFDLLALTLATVAIAGAIFAAWYLVLSRWILKKKSAGIALSVLTGLLLIWGVFFHTYGQCDSRSKFCTVGIPHTRSEVGFEWSGWHLYTSTSGDDPATHVLF